MLPVIAQGLADALPKLIPAIVTGIIQLMKVFNDNMTLFLECGVKIIWGIVQGLISSIPIILQNLPTIIEFIINFFTIEKLLSAGKMLMSSLWKGITQGLPELLKNIPKLIGNIVNTFKSGGNLKDVGVNLIKGLWNGISSVKDWIGKKIGGFANGIVKGFKKALGIHSPSVIMEKQIGINVGLGVVEGIDDTQKQINETIGGISASMTAGIGSNFSAMGTMQSSNIRPIINVYNNMELDPLGQVVSNVKTFSGGAKNDYNYGVGV
jgi:phage-related protein